MIKEQCMMNDSISQDVSRLELFPDEIFLELLSFIRPIDLYHAFVNLNSRLNYIINDIDICIHIINNKECKNYQSCINYFVHQIIYLAIDLHWSCLSYNLHLQSFVNLRSLHLPMPNAKQCLEITPDNLPFLTNLTINNKSFRSLLFGSNSFPHLLTCSIPGV
jgi:hypothetical protein